MTRKVPQKGFTLTSCSSSSSPKFHGARTFYFLPYAPDIFHPLGKFFWNTTFKKAERLLYFLLLIYLAPIHSRSEKVRQVNPKKFYAIDTGLLSAMSLKMTQDRGAMLENMVYMQLRRQGIAAEYYVTESGSEVDFLFIDRTGNKGLIQVCWDLDDDRTYSREVRALHQAMRELSIKRSAMVTWNTESTRDERITIIPAWKWLLEQD
jgi:hypothetical protein